MKTIIAGSRELNDFSILQRCIKESGFKITEVVCSDAEGIDKLAKEWAEKNNIPVAFFPADWSKHQENAWVVANEQMAAYAEAAVILIKNFSEGSTHMMNTAKNKKLKLYTYHCFS